jgi:hypothetical protein
MRAGLIFIAALIIILMPSCQKDNEKSLRYFEVGIKGSQEDWRDSSFVVATTDRQLVNAIMEQLKKPIAARRIVMGELASGSGGYNKNAGHSFNWHFIENKWGLVDVSAEIYDGRAYSDVEKNPGYWLGTLKRFSPWGSYVKKEIIR